MNTNVTVYTRTGCTACHATTRYLDKNGIAYTEVTADDPDVVADLKARGFLSLPVVQTDDETWTGFRLDKLRSLAA